MIYIIIFATMKIMMGDKFKIKNAFTICLVVALFGVTVIFPITKKDNYITESSKSLIEFSDGIYITKSIDSYTDSNIYSYKEITENGEIVININSKKHPVYIKYSNYFRPQISYYVNHYYTSTTVYNALFVVVPIYAKEDYYIITLPNKEAIKYI